MFPLKERIILFFLNMLIAFLMIVFTYVGVTSVIKYLSFPDVFEYSTGCVILSFSAIVLGPVFISGFPVVFLGRRFEHKVAAILNKMVIWGFVVAVFSGVLFRIYYISEIKSLKYVECHNKNSGAFSALSTRYALTLGDCGR
ncbi:hypothetical protein N3553_03545 [Pantoea dispersa]|jgi:hypothetical protein|uniref:hypothetical protein n=1 Tax=Pantoea dispersa TaxID=59814 RepID=UPI0021B063C2|nr:hypothetical protein [Pantoea dispersa]MCT6588952.1 hypothetical protein [Pantoea dispersa]MCW0319392.1 hypothetical protein [Pantoea dispersa]MCW0324128.1 hypothetical protein [Pantoea dispersa]MCW0432145.1 hypothetical protein [Pantoea dispersa]